MLPVLPSTNRVHLDSNSSGGTSTGHKRSASMIFRIEHLLPTSTAPDLSLLQATSANHIRPLMKPPSDFNISEYHEQSSTTPPPSKRVKLLPPRSGVFVSEFTRKDTLSESIATLPLMSASVSPPSEQQSTRVYCTFSPDNVLCITPAIMRKVKLSEDIHSYNALFELCSAGGVRLRTVRDICADDEVVAWFGEETTLLMAIPFLTPLNIQGNKRYTCHLCHLTFETPNPLKIHLALGCGRHSMDILWIRLHYAVKATKHYNRQHLLPPSVPPLATQLSPSSHYYQHPSITNTTTATSSTSSLSPAASPQPPTPQRFSAFKTISSSSHCIITTSSASSSMPPASLNLPLYSTSTITPTTTSLTTFLPTLSASVGLPSMSLLHPPGGSLHPLNAAAQIEALVSNMGASKQGHLCIYCGKVYSRKYGLKIHIRTHTGFKPLKCKFCLRPFGDPSNLNKHVRLHLQTSSPGSTSGGSTEGYKCHLCNKTLARRRDLQRHIESRHASGGESVESTVTAEEVNSQKARS